MEGDEEEVEEEEVAGEEDELEMNQLIAVKKINERKDFHQPMSTFYIQKRANYWPITVSIKCDSPVVPGPKSRGRTQHDKTLRLEL